MNRKDSITGFHERQSEGGLNIYKVMKIFTQMLDLELTLKITIVYKRRKDKVCPCYSLKL